MALPIGLDEAAMIRCSLALLGVGCRLQLMSRFHVFYSAMPEMGSGFKPVEAADAYEAEQVVQREFPGAVTATLSERVTDKEKIQEMFMEWLGKI